MSVSGNKSAQVRPFCSAPEQASWQTRVATTMPVDLGAARLDSIRLKRGCREAPAKTGRRHVGDDDHIGVRLINRVMPP